MDLNLIAGAAATVALFVPVVLIVAGRLYTNGSFLALFINHLFAGIYNLMDLDLLPATKLFKHQAGTVFNYLDAPLMLVWLLYFCNEPRKRRLVQGLLALFLVFDLIVAITFGFSVQSSVYLLGPGTVIVLGLSLLFFLHYGKTCIVRGKGCGKTFMLVSLIFSYALFLILYYLHYLVRTPAEADVFLIYYIGVFIAALLLSVGLVSIIRRARDIKERQLTRRELALFFDS